MKNKTTKYILHTIHPQLRFDSGRSNCSLYAMFRAFHRIFLTFEMFKAQYIFYSDIAFTLSLLLCNFIYYFKVAWRKVSKDYPLTVGLTTFDPKEDMSVSFQQITEYRSRWDLVIKRVEMKHKGLYECQISATVVHTHHVYLNVLRKYQSSL